MFFIFSSQAYFNLICVIKFSNEQIYYLGKPIVLKIEIINKSYNNYFLQIANDISYNFNFIIISSDGEQIEYKEDYILKKRSIDKVFTKEIMLSPNEAYSVEIDVNQWFDFKKEGMYFIQGVFYPYIDSNERIISQNILKLNLKPKLEGETQIVKKVFQTEVERLKLKEIPPYKILELHLKARQRRDWNEFFLYIDFDSFIMNYPSYRDKYKYASESSRLNIIEDFKNYLISTFYNDLLYFEIRKVLIEIDRCKIDTYLEFSYKNYIEKYQAEYYLRLKDQIWLIIGYEITPVRK
ncbi:MAG: hypothetical protein N3A58_04220 [Spirochaetes bacterium]|nr:hypothetical protein [Spirochaetota bacterium]